MKDNYSLGEDILNVENVSLSIDGKLILRDINLNIKDIIRPGHTQGQIISLLGNSGAGKTQLFKLLSGLNKPTTGTITLGTDKIPVKAGDVGVVAQNYPLFEHRTVWSNLEMVCKEKTAAERKERVEFYLNRFKMLEHKDKYPAVLSGGQRQRIAIIQQLLCSEFFLLMDEPFSGLDPVMKDNTCKMIEEVANLNEKTTIIIVSHDIPSTVAISQYVWLLGFDYDNGEKIPGSRIKYMENLMDRGLSWKPDLVNTAEFFSFVKDIRNTFNEL
jgi:ABC-type nitrate/sulfonate/bicarbonate transport system ATPase subunit